MYLGHRAEVCTLIAQAELKSRTAKKSVKLIVSVLRCSHSPLAPRLAHSSVTTEWPFQLVPGDLLLLVGPCLFLRPSRPSHRRAAAWPVRVTDDCDTKPAKVLNCLYYSEAAAAIDELPPAPARTRGERVRGYKVVINFEQQFQQPQG